MEMKEMHVVDGVLGFCLTKQLGACRGCPWVMSSRMVLVLPPSPHPIRASERMDTVQSE